MPIDIGTFRAVASKANEANLLYVQDGKLKSAAAGKSGGSAQFDDFKAATTAFLDSYKKHYGAALGQMARNTLQEYAEMGRPLSASVVTQLIDIAEKTVDEKMGSRTCVKVGDTVVDLSRLGTDKLLSTGSFKSTKLRNAAKGGARAAERTFLALAPTDAGKVDVRGLLRHLETLHAYTIREIKAKGLRELAAQEAGAPEAPRTSASEIETKTFEKLLFKGIDALDNKTLSGVYQGLVTRETDALKKELARLVDRPNADPIARAAAERFFTDLCRMEAMVVSEVSRRMELARTPADQVQNVPSLMDRYCGNAALAANRFGDDKDMTTLNLGLMTRLAAKGSVEGGRIDAETNAKIAQRKIAGVDAKQIGDMIRNNELTINFQLGAVMGWRRNGTKTTSLFKKQNAQILNTFQSKEEQNLAVDGTGYLKLRDQVERSFFPEYVPEPLKGRERPAYGALNTKKLYAGAADTPQATYGRVVVVLKEHVKRQCTYTLGDTFFLSTLKLKPELRPAFEENLVAAFAGRLDDPAAALAELKAEGDANPLNRFMRQTSGDRVGYDTVLSLCIDLIAVLNRHLAEGAAELDKFEMFAHLEALYANHGEHRGNVATYDNVENLLAGKGDFTALNMAVSTMKRQSDPAHKVSLRNADYIEAQVHGPILLDRDVEEIRIDTFSFEERAGNEFDALPEAQKEAIWNDPALGNSRYARKQEWERRRAAEIEVAVRREVANAPCKIVFYNSEGSANAAISEAELALNADVLETAGHMKPELADYAESLCGKDHKADIYKAALEKARSKSDVPLENARRLWGENLENVPDWLSDVIDANLRRVIAEMTVDKNGVKSREDVLTCAITCALDRLSHVDDIVAALDENGIRDADARMAIIRNVLEAPIRDRQFGNLLSLLIAEHKALSDLPKLVADTFANEIENGAEILPLAYNGVPPVGGRALDKLASELKLQVRAYKETILDDHTKKLDNAPETFVSLLRRKVVKPMVEKKAHLLLSQAGWTFPSDDERNAFISWAASAGKLRFLEELKGVYESSTKLAKALEDKLANGATPTARDIVDAFKAFYPVCHDFMTLDKRNHGEYGPDDQSAAVTRAVSVAMSRLAVRLGADAMKRLAAAFGRAETCALYCGAAAGLNAPFQPEDALSRTGNYYMFTVFMDVFYQRLPEKFDVPLARPEIRGGLPLAAISPATRDLMRLVNAAQTNALDTIPFDPNAAVRGARRLARMAPPANPGGMPQDRPARKAFLLRMLPIYHNHEKTFDKGNNWHGRTHATRSFVFSVAMANIFREKGVDVDMNAVALATAGHDTGREANGPDSDDSEARSGDIVTSMVEQLHPDAAGDAWKGQVKANIATKAVNQTTLEGYLFKSGDSLDYSRIADLDPKRFPFLRETVVTRDGLVVAVDESLRRQLMKEARLLAERTDYGTARGEEIKQFQIQLAQLSSRRAPENEILAVQDRQKTVEDEIHAKETEQTNTLSDAQIVELVENTIRDNPGDFPLLTKYYLDADA